MQLEALSALYNLCKISKVRQEAAAVAHAVPHLTRLASAPAQARRRCLPPRVPSCTEPVVVLYVDMYFCPVHSISMVKCGDASITRHPRSR